MNITMWEPFRDMVSLREAMDRLLEESVIRPSRSTSMAMAMPINVSEHENEYVIEAEMPGVRPEDVDISATGNTVTIRAECKPPEQRQQGPQGQQGQQGQQQGQQGQKQVQQQNQQQGQRQGSYLLRETRYGTYTRTITLPTEIKAGDAKADFEHGVLTLTLPKSEEARTRKIPVTGGNQGTRQISSGTQ